MSILPLSISKSIKIKCLSCDSPQQCEGTVQLQQYTWLVGERVPWNHTRQDTGERDTTAKDMC
jgi:hypothetical protein